MSCHGRHRGDLITAQALLEGFEPARYTATAAGGGGGRIQLQAAR